MDPTEQVALAFLLREEKDPVSEALCFVWNSMIDEVQKLSNHKGNTPSSEPFRIFILNISSCAYV
jgi:hypothetical protein